VSSSIPEYFSLFGLEPRFAIDLEALTRAYDEVLALVHPDRHVRAGAGERRAAMQMASHANEAFRVLRTDTARAAYLCRSHGANVDGPGAAPLDPAQLEQQMRWRETLDEAGHGPAAREIALGVEREAATARVGTLQRIARHIDAEGNYLAAAAEVRILMFLDKLIAECERQLGASATVDG
jgi:molecular chaperone HscB